MKDEEILDREISEKTLKLQWEFDDNVQIPEGFTEWFLKSAVHLGKISSLPDDLKVHQNTRGQCFHNSQLVSIDNKDVKYFEGLMYGPVFKNSLHHGFNQNTNGVIDVIFIKSLIKSMVLKDKIFIKNRKLY